MMMTDGERLAALREARALISICTTQIDDIQGFYQFDLQAQMKERGIRPLGLLHDELDRLERDLCRR